MLIPCLLTLHHRSIPPRVHHNSHTHTSHRYQKADGVKQDVPKAIELFERAAALGHSIAMNALGVIFDNGHGGVSKDFGLALYWFQQAAEAGCVPAMKNLGIVFEYGRVGVMAKDEHKAFEYYRMAADKGNEPAKEVCN